MQPTLPSDYKQLLTDVIKKQIVILGPDITLSKARNVKGITVADDGTVTALDGSPQEVTQALIDQFVQLSGLIVKKTMEPLLLATQAPMQAQLVPTQQPAPSAQTNVQTTPTPPAPTMTSQSQPADSTPTPAAPQPIPPVIPTPQPTAEVIPPMPQPTPISQQAVTTDDNLLPLQPIPQVPPSPVETPIATSIPQPTTPSTQEAKPAENPLAA